MTRRRLPALPALAVPAAALLVSALLVSVTAPLGAAAPTPAEEVRRRAERILATPGYQTALPAAGETEEPPLRRDLAPLAALLVQALFWLTIAAAVVLVLYLLWDLLARGGRRRSPSAGTDAPPRAAPPDEPAASPLPDPEALAREGRFGEAVHALLLTALARLARRRGAPLPRSLTSREVLALGDLEAEPRTDLAELVTAVERFLFAGRPLGAEDWERCFLAFRRLQTYAPHPDAGGTA